MEPGGDRSLSGVSLPDNKGDAMILSTSNMVLSPMRVLPG